MNKYKLEDLKVGAVFKNGDETRTIIAVGKSEVFYSYRFTCSCGESVRTIGEFLRGDKGELVRPTMKVAYVEYQSKSDLITKHYCSKEDWNRGIDNSRRHKLIREFEMELGADGFPIKGVYE